MSITLGTKTDFTPQANASSPQTQSHTVSSGTKLLVVAVTIFDTSSTDGIVSGVTFGAQELIQGTLHYDATCDGHISIWYLKNPIIDTATVSVAFGGIVTDFMASVIDVKGTGFALDSTATPAAGNGSPSINITTVDTDTIIFDAMLTDQANGANVTVDSAQTAMYKEDVGGDTVGASYKVVATQDTHNMSWADSDNDEDWTSVAIAFAENAPPTVALNTADETNFGADTTPTLEFTGTDADGDDVRYDIQIDTVNTFDSLGWGLINASDDSKSFNTDTLEDDPKGVNFSSDGTKMYVVGDTNLTVYQYTLSPAWDVSSAVDASKSFSVSTQISGPKGICFDSTGEIAYVLNNTDDTVYQYALSTAWDASTGAYDSKSFSFNSQETNTRAFTLSSDGTKMYAIGSSNTAVYQYTLSTAWNVSTASYASKWIDFPLDSNPEGLVFNSDGTKMFINGTANDEIYEYILTTAWDITTAIYSVSYDHAPDNAIVYDLAFGNSGKKMYLVNFSNPIDQYSTEAPLLDKMSGGSDTQIAYFDGSDAAATDSGTDWTNVTNADDGDILTAASCTTQPSSILSIEGTNYTGSGNIIQVRFRAYGLGGSPSNARVRIYEDGGSNLLGTNNTAVPFTEAGWGDFTILSTHSGGWTQAKVQALEVKADIDSALSPSFDLYKVEIEVTYDGFANTVTGADTDPFNSGEKADYDVQPDDALSEDTYYWRVKAKDPSGADIYGAWATTRSFTVSFATEINVSDSVSIADVPTVSVETPTGDLSIDVFDAISIAENVVITNTQLGGISVSDDVSITENVSITNTQLGGISVSDDISIIEDVTLENTLNINVNDSVSITESISATNTQLGGISVNDAITIAELVSIGQTYSISAFDNISIAENVVITNTQLGGVNVSDNISISENVVLELVSNIDVSDSISISENITITNTQLGGINVNDDITITDIVIVGFIVPISISDSVSINENVQITNTQLGNIDISDDVSIAESVILENILFVNANDSVSVSENVDIQNTQLGGVSVNDNISIAELVAIGFNYSVSIVDNVSIVENITIENTQLGDISVNDNVAVSENVDLESVSNINVSDDITITESITLKNTQLGGINVSDDISIAENIVLTQEYNISISDSISINEDVVVENIQLGGIDVSDLVNITELVQIGFNYSISISDDIAISENISIENIQLGGVDVNDLIVITDVPTVIIEEVGVTSINISDLVSITDVPIVENEQLGGVDVSDAIGISEDIVIENTLNIEVNDVVTINENILIENIQLGGVSVSDSVSISELITIGKGSFISVQDTISITEGITIENEQLGDISISDDISITEDVTISIILAGAEINISDTIAVAENVIANEQLGNINVFDSVVVWENIVLWLPSVALNINTSDSVAVSENFVIDNTQLPGISVNDSITITENVVTEHIIIVLYADVFDSISIGESITIENTQLGSISVSDLVLIDDLDISIENLPGDISISDSISIVDNVVITPPAIRVSASEGISVSESIGIENPLLSTNVNDTITITEDVEPFKRIRNPYYKKQKLYTVSRKYRKKRKIYTTTQKYKKKRKIYTV